jgi:hypothetical protein
VLEREQAAAERQEGVVEVLAAFVPRTQSARAVEVGEGPLDYSAMATESRARVDAPARDACVDVAGAARSARARAVVGRVGVQFVWAAARLAHAASHRRHGVERLLEDGDLVLVRRGQPLCEPDASRISEDTTLRPRAGVVGRVWSRRFGVHGCFPFALPGRYPSPRAPIETVGRLKPRAKRRLQRTPHAGAVPIT